MTSLIGSYECKVDAKGRLALPMDLRKQLEDVLEKGFILKRSVFKPCLELHPIDEWNRVMEKMGKLNPFVKKNSDFIRRFTAGAKPVELDSNGRLQIAKDLVNYAKIEKNVVLSSYIYIIEIWNKDLYEAEINNEEVDFGALAEEVMGSLGDELP
ncbi:division/cell wall cluster transcriptional repressor MraZ [Ornithobacterium rhinotracheale]|uniref:Transcriptional regulator MraZ n=1 Tax=Ornithobacterium rhinotracheale (strain ATCC 51463 / DSM 15997 / CCUG 23171 / CIP 104009 / LMG 9086) TaxID=867902 RepID=I3ZYJ3_ORNRL|nr:division/cell wall cluster transcriptional repressor MraZ [Ornithobacterium rhinotracheale]AFL96777.1 mraZ protein [Ornithobacterium rhinotracheale DSM 15997]AIP99453.1 MraZ family transcriptional regulator [Ornithobacterium rhinotracheale ORT-UMN 88]KGB66485.1 MraZ family transcriptional regulator [Ornithobacterium rhinotracheale H06-030791]MCK0194125.1 division/cell wall cluster transcriptional repressor MraZ [Ornithobacterium rhinotracheale]MCK0199630.1 division/cell wall cluster transcr